MCSLQYRCDALTFHEKKYNIKLCDCQNTGGGRAPAAPAVAGGQPVDTIRRDEVATKSFFHPYCNLPKGEIAIGRDKMGAPIWGHPNFGLIEFEINEGWLNKY